jgi:hypothetical protein
MLAIVGIVVVFGAVLGGYLMEKGHLMVLLQPAELLSSQAPAQERSWSQIRRVS